MNELTPQEMALLASSAIGCSIADLMRVLPVMTIEEREAILDEAKRLNAVTAPTGKPPRNYTCTC
jgi:hypothetical protein